MDFNKFYNDTTIKMNLKKIQWHSHDFLLPCNTTEENVLSAQHSYLNFIMYALNELNELSAFLIFIVHNFAA